MLVYFIFYKIILSFAKKVLVTALPMRLFFAKGSVGEEKCLFGANILVIKRRNILLRRV